MTALDLPTLGRLGDHGMTVVHESDDIRGLHVTDSHGKRIGRVIDLLIDLDARKVRFIEVDHGGLLGFGAVPSFVPVEAVIALADGEVQLNTTGAHVADSPGYNPEIGPDNDFYGDLYSHYGHVPYWTPGYRYPLFPFGTNKVINRDRD